MREKKRKRNERGESYTLANISLREMEKYLLFNMAFQTVSFASKVPVSSIDVHSEQTFQLPDPELLSKSSVDLAFLKRFRIGFQGTFDLELTVRKHSTYLKRGYYSFSRIV